MEPWVLSDKEFFDGRGVRLPRGILGNVLIDSGALKFEIDGDRYSFPWPPQMQPSDEEWKNFKI